jgi:ubiquinone/menaquinone biosynthesis C-methylase UbiE
MLLNNPRSVNMDDTETGQFVSPSTWGTFWDVFGEKLVSLMDIPEGAKVLDVGSGGGSVLYPLAKRVGAKGHVTGVELCEHCFKRTSSEIIRCKVLNAEVLNRDATETGFLDESFDCVTAGFIGWDDYFDFQTNAYIRPDSLMKEITRVLRPGGLFGMSTWLRQEDLDWMYQLLRSQSIDCRKNYSIENATGWRKIMTSWGYKDVQIFTQAVTYDYDSVDFWWDEMTDYDWVEDRDRKKLGESLKTLALQRVKPLGKGGKIPFLREALFVIGKKTI